MVNLDKIPATLKALPQWVKWRIIDRGGDKTKVPVTSDGKWAKSNDSTTWGTFEATAGALTGQDAGLGFVFAESRELTGIDLDGCRNPETGEFAEWARAIITYLATYGEISPSGTGCKLWVRGRSPLPKGRKTGVPFAPVCEKAPAIEVYDHSRFFAVTGHRVKGPHEPEERQEQLDSLCAEWFKPEEMPTAGHGVAPDESEVISRARKYLERIPAAISGQGGHNATFKAACVLVLGFGLSEGDAYNLLTGWNAGCNPPWSERDLRRKVREAAKQTGERNYLRFAEPANWDAVKLPDYGGKPAVKQADEKPSIITITPLVDAAEAWITRAAEGHDVLVSLGVPGLDESIGGGVAPGEFVVLAARPSHGKSAVAMQSVHNWTETGKPVAIVSEEMSAIALGKRTLQFVSEIPMEHWFQRTDALRTELRRYHERRAPAYVIEGCRSAENAAEQIRKMVTERSVQCAVIDYAQLLQSPGKSRYEQVTNTSVCLRQLANDCKIVLLVLAQLSRAIESRTVWVFQMSDLKESGQIEQDADVVIGMYWPWKVDGTKPPQEYQFHIAKNRNREITSRLLTCRFEASRQRIVAGESTPRYREREPERHGHFDEWNQSSGSEFT